MSDDRPLAKAAVRATASEDWYVGVGGVPLGPVRLAVIREKALAGAVDGDSLVWREGFDEWQPLKNFPELLDIVMQAQSTRLSAPGRRISTSFSAVHPPAPQGAHPDRPVAAGASGPSSIRSLSAAHVQPSSRIAAPAREQTAPSAPTPLSGAQAPAFSSLVEPEPPPVDPVPSPMASAAAAFSVAGRSAAAPAPAPAVQTSPAVPGTWPSATGGISRSSVEAAAPIGRLPEPFAGQPAAHAVPSPEPQPSPLAPAAPLAQPSPLAPAAPLAPANVMPTTSTTAPVPMTSSMGLSAEEPAPLLATRASLVETVSPRRSSGMSPMAYAFIAMAAAFGGVSAYVLLSPKPQQQPVPVAPVLPQSQPPVLPTAAPPPPPSIEAVEAPPPVQASPPVEAPPPVQAPPPVATAPAKAGLSAPPSRTGDAPSPAQRPQPEKPVASAGATSFDRSGFGGTGVPGPTSGPGAQQSSGLGQLSQGEIAGVVEANRPGVRRHCWQPALDARPPGAASNARVSASVVIGPSGAVQSVTANGSEKDYPGLASCISSRIRSWKFPPSSGTTPVNIPFVFAAQ